MRELNVTYYFSQIKPEYRGDLALFMEIPEKEPVFTSFGLDSQQLMAVTSEMHSPMRAYLGVNSKAKPALAKRFEQGNLRSAHDLDHIIVREEIVKRRYEEICDLQGASLTAAIATGK